MRTVLLAAALFAAPLMAQTTPSTGSAPSTTPADTSQMGSTPMTSDATTPAAATSAAMPMADGKLPWCRTGQFTGCRERENAKGQGLRKD